jgi:hypothetical protein
VFIQDETPDDHQWKDLPSRVMPPLTGYLTQDPTGAPVMNRSTVLAVVLVGVLVVQGGASAAIGSSTAPQSDDCSSGSMVEGIFPDSILAGQNCGNGDSDGGGSAADGGSDGANTTTTEQSASSDAGGTDTVDVGSAVNAASSALSGATGTSGAQTGGTQAQAGQGSLEFTVDDLDGDLSAGDQGTISGTITNDGSETAENAVLTFAGNASAVMPRQSQVVLDDIESGESVDFELPVAVAQGAPPGERQLPLQVSYQTEDGQQATSAPLAAQVAIEEGETSFEVTSVDSDLEPGEQGTVEVTVENQQGDLTDAVVNLQSLSSNLVFGQAANTSQFVGDWDEGDTETFEVQTTATETATDGDFPVRASVSYTDENNQPGQATPIVFGVEIDESVNDFEITNVDSGTLAPGEQGTIEVTLENQDEDVTDATVNVQSTNTALTFGQSANATAFVGDWDEGETQTIQVRAAVAQSATNGEYPLRASVSYNTGDDNQPERSGPFAFGVDIGEFSNDLEVTDVNSDLEPGERGTIEVTLENQGQDGTNARVNLQSLSSSIGFGQVRPNVQGTVQNAEATTNTSVFVGDWDEGETQTIEFQATAAEGATEGEYPLRATAVYDGEDDRPIQVGPAAFGAQIGGSTDDFQVVNVNSTVPVGGEGTIRVTINNTEENATESTVSLQSISTNFQLDEGVNATQFVGQWDVGEQRVLEYQVAASNETQTRSYAFQTSVRYTDSTDQNVRRGPLAIGVTPLPEQSFTLSNTTDNLRVGSEGNTSGTITNQGPQVARNAVVTLSVNNENVNVQQQEAAIGTLRPGQSANFSFPVELSDSAQAGPQQFSYTVDYDNQDGEARSNSSLATQVEVEPQRDAFIVGGSGSTSENDQSEQANASNGTSGQAGQSNVRAQQVAQVAAAQQTGQSGGESESSVQPGSSEVVSVPITNNRDVVLRNIEVQAFTNDPLSLADDQAFISQLEPGEQTNISFEISATSEALPGTYPLSVDLQYETPDGDTQLSDTYEVPIQVEEQSGGILSSLTGGGFPVVAVLIAILIIVALAVVWYRRRDSEPDSTASESDDFSFESTEASESGATTDSSGPIEADDSPDSTRN